MLSCRNLYRALPVSKRSGHPASSHALRCAPECFSFLRESNTSTSWTCQPTCSKFCTVTECIYLFRQMCNASGFTIFHPIQLMSQPRSFIKLRRKHPHRSPTSHSPSSSESTSSSLNSKPHTSLQQPHLLPQGHAHSSKSCLFEAAHVRLVLWVCSQLILHRDTRVSFGNVTANLVPHFPTSSSRRVSRVGPRPDVQCNILCHRPLPAAPRTIATKI